MYFPPFLFLSVKKRRFPLSCPFGFSYLSPCLLHFFEDGRGPLILQGSAPLHFFGTSRTGPGKDTKGGETSRMKRQKIMGAHIYPKNKREKTSKNRINQDCPFVIKEKATWCNHRGIALWAQNIRADGYTVAFEY